MQPDDSLSRTLKSWRVAPKASANFRADVWQRIEAARRAGGESWSAYLRNHLAVWLAVLVVTLGGSGWIGLSAAQAQNAATRQKMVAAYVQRIDPRAQVKP